MSWEPDPDQIAGVADLFGGLTRDELGRGLREVAFKRGIDADPAEYDAAIREAVESYALLAVTHDGDLVLVPGPVAFPSLPEGAADLPHILEVTPRTIHPTDRATRVRRRLEAEAERVVEDGASDRAATLLEVTYDAETWAPVELDDIRQRLRAVL